jgi:hypothetical protein
MMDGKPVIMVQIDEPQWTQSVMRSACALAQRQNARIVLVKLVPVRHALYLGTGMGYLDLDEQEVLSLQKYADMAADCHVDCDIKVYQYWDLFRAINDAAGWLGASTVFARLPRSRFFFWNEARWEVLRQHLAHQSAELFDRPLAQEQ